MHMWDVVHGAMMMGTQGPLGCNSLISLVIDPAMGELDPKVVPLLVF